MDLDAAMTPTPAGDDAFGWDVPDGWQQGRGAFGGLVVGALIGAGEAALADPERPLRAVTAELMAPAVPGPSTIRVTRLRAGRSVTVMTAVLAQPGGPVAHAVLTFGRTRDDAGWQALDPPALPPWAELALLEVPSPPGPRFVRHFELRPVTGAPFSGAPAAAPEVLGWVRPRAPGTGRGAAYLAACVDAYWPAFLVGERAPRPAATLTYTLQLTGAAAPPAAPLAYRARALAAGDGYVPELRELWTADGRLVAVNPQTFALSR
jgi:Acyl-CoA thioesterase N-terminal domain/Acyl-CoA thioesterase C-terminal domain